MQVHYDEGVAIHIDPEPCVGVRKDEMAANSGRPRHKRRRALATRIVGLHSTGTAKQGISR